MTKIIRTPRKALGGITPAEKAALDAHTAKWIANAMSTEPVVPERLIPAIKALYAAAGLKEPRIVIVPSPIVMAFAGGFASAIWWARKNNAKATSDATRAATYAATYAATRDATRAATRDATDAATDVATRAATYAATYAATRDATDAATRAATDAATYAATDVATRAATYAATYAATDVATLAVEIGAEIGVNSRFLASCAAYWYMWYQGGNMWSSWECYITAFRDVLGLVLPEHDKYRAWESCAIEGGFRFMHDEFCIVSDRPERLLVDTEHRPHCAEGPSHRWRDGWSLYHWHGLRIPIDLEYVIHSPQQITVAGIESQQNAELRRVMIDRYGPARYVADSGAIVVHELPADHPMQGLRSAKLLLKNVPDDEPIVYVDLLNSTPEPDNTTKRYMLRVDPNAYNGEAARNVHAAAASTWRNADGSLSFKRWQDYRPSLES